MGAEDFQETVLTRWESSSSSPSSSMESTLSEDSSSEISDDATSSSSNDHAGPLFQLSDLMTQLPIKRGLSKFYDGKSQTFASLESVLSVEDLSKATFNRTRFGRSRKMIKSCKSYAGEMLDMDSSSSSSHKSLAATYSPKAIISKKTSPNSTSRHLFAASFIKRQHPSSSFKPSPSINLLHLI